MQIKIFAIMVIGVIGVLGWLIASPDPKRSEQESLIRNSEPHLDHSFARVLSHSEELGVASRAPASASSPVPAGPGQAPSGGSSGSSGSEAEMSPADIREMEYLSELVQAPVTDENDLVNRFHQARQQYHQSQSERAIGTLRELISMMRLMYGTDPRLPDLELEMNSIEQERVDRLNREAASNPRK